MSKRNIAIAVILLVVAAAVAVGFTTDGFGLKGLIFKSKGTKDVKYHSCSAAYFPKVEYVYPQPVGDGGAYQMYWTIGNWCNDAKLKLYTYIGDYFTTSKVESNIQQNIYPPTLAWYTIGGEYASDLSPTSACSVTGKCLTTNNMTVFKLDNSSVYTLEPSAAAKVPVVVSSDIITTKGKMYFLLKVTDKNNEELAKSPIIAVTAYTSPSIKDLEIMGSTTRQYGEAYRLKWTVKNMSPEYKIELRLYTAEVYPYTAEPKTAQYVPGIKTLSYYTFEAPWWGNVYQNQDVGLPIYDSKSPYMAAPQIPKKHFMALIMKFKNQVYYESPIFAVFKSSYGKK